MTIKEFDIFISSRGYSLGSGEGSSIGFIYGTLSPFSDDPKGILSGNSKVGYTVWVSWLNDEDQRVGAEFTYTTPMTIPLATELLNAVEKYKQKA
jgi:hypothetical protein